MSEWNLLHDIPNPSKWTKFSDIHYSPIIHGCMNTLKVRSKFKNFWIWLDSGCISTILIKRLIETVNPKRYDAMQWHTQAGNINTYLKVKTDFTLPKLSAMKIVMRNCHVDDSDKVRYDMILGRDSLTGSVLNLKWSDHVI